MITLAVLNVDALVTDSMRPIVREKEIVTIIDGYTGPSVLRDIQFNTVNPYSKNYVRINRSVNKAGGASFTYQFWMRVDEANDELFKDKIIFLKGDSRKFNLIYYKLNGDMYQQNSTKQLPPDYYVCCPMIKFGASYRDLKVYFNTNNDALTVINISMNASDESTSRKNLLSMLPMRWMLFTFVFEDNYSFTASAEDGIRFTMYVNDVAYWMESASRSPALKNNSIKQNDGDLIMTPDIGYTAEFFKIGNFKYYNYAVGINDVINVFNAGPPTYSMTVKSNSVTSSAPTFIHSVNKLDIYNY